MPALCDFPADRVSTSQSDLTLDVKNVKSVASYSRSRRPVSQRWFYESGSKDVDPLTPSLPKRKSNPPQRLTASRLGLMAVSSSDSSSREAAGVSSDLAGVAPTAGLPSRLGFSSPGPTFHGSRDQRADNNSPPPADGVFFCGQYFFALHH